MATIEQIRKGIAANIKAAMPDDVQISAYVLAQPTPPTIHVMPSRIDYDQAMHSGMQNAIFTVQMVVGAVGDIAAQMRLDRYIMAGGTTSVKAAIESDPTLGGIVDDLQVTDCTGYQTIAFDGRAPLLGCTWSLWVMMGAA